MILGHASHSVSMADNTQFTSITLDGDPLNLKVEPVKLSVFPWN
jgi:hypothetical protein